jgi:hypothetical protein
LASAELAVIGAPPPPKPAAPDDGIGGRCDGGGSLHPGGGGGGGAPPGGGGGPAVRPGRHASATVPPARRRASRSLEPAVPCPVGLASHGVEQSQRHRRRRRVGEPANLARVHWRRRGRSPTCVSKLNECTEKDECTVKDECTEIVSGKVSRASTQELIIYKKGGQTTRKSALKCAGSSHYLQKKVPITM